MAVLVYISASKSMLANLDIVQARALRTCLGAVRTTPVCAMQLEAGEMPLGLRRLELAANYWINISGHRKYHQVKNVLQLSWEKEKTHRESFDWT